jgi:hypothetical protein
MIERITKAQLNTLTAKHNNNMNLPILTNAVFVTREHLDRFLNSLPREHDAYKICFIRHDSPPLDTRISPAGNNLTQLSLIFVPMKDTNQATWESTEADENGMISTLSFCVPGRPDNNTTGHCPPASGCNT